MEQKQHSYTRKIGRTTYTIIVEHSPTAKETVYEKVRKLILSDFDEMYSGGGSN